MPDVENALPITIIADNLSKAGWSWGCVSAIDLEARTIWIVDAHRDDGKRFVVHADDGVSRTGSGNCKFYSDEAGPFLWINVTLPPVNVYVAVGTLKTKLRIRLSRSLS